MAIMPNDFISRATVLSDIEQTIENSGCVNHEREIIDCVRYADASDVVQVVRCKDCEQYVAGEIGYGKCNFFKTAIFSEFYCRYGGKKGMSE